MEHKKKSVEAAVANSKKAREKQGGIPGINKKASGLKLRRIMDAQGITVKDVQQYLGLGSVQSVYHWLNGISMPTVDNLYAMSELLQVSMDEMGCGNRTRDISGGIAADGVCGVNTLAGNGIAADSMREVAVFAEAILVWFHEKTARSILGYPDTVSKYECMPDEETANAEQMDCEASGWLHFCLFISANQNGKRMAAYYKKAGGNLAA